METFTDETPTRLDALREAAERGEAQAFKRAVHALNGIRRGVGASDIASICLKLEKQADSDALQRAPELLTRLEEEFDRVNILLDTELSE